MKSVPTRRKRCRTFGCSWHSLASTLQTLLPLTLRVPSPSQLQTDAQAVLCPTRPNKPETKPVLLTNRFICILTGAQILDTDFFCTTVQEPVQNMLFFLFIHIQKIPKTNKWKDKECGSIYSQLYASASHRPSSTCPSCQLCGQHCLPLTAALSVKRGNSPLKDKHSPPASQDSRLLK